VESKSLHTKLGKVLGRGIFPSPSCHGPDFAVTKIKKQIQFRCNNPHKLPRFFNIPARRPARLPILLASACLPTNPFFLMLQQSVIQLVFLKHN
jgi:hypothetical protein